MFNMYMYSILRRQQEKHTLVGLTIVRTSLLLNGKSSLEFPLKLYMATTSVPGGHCSCTIGWIDIAYLLPYFLYPEKESEH